MKAEAEAAAHPPPSFYEDLEATHAEAFRLIARGVKDRRAASHAPTVATVGVDGAPVVRTMILRGFDPETRVLRFHTDFRTGKVGEIAREPRMSAHIYDPGAKIQLRLAGRGRIEQDTPAADAAWAASRPFSRDCYRVVPAPGEGLDDPTTVACDPADLAVPPRSGRDRFAILLFAFDRLEWLYLAHCGHRRARFSWDAKEGCEAGWLVP